MMQNFDIDSIISGSTLHYNNLSLVQLNGIEVNVSQAHRNRKSLCTVSTLIHHNMRWPEKLSDKLSAAGPLSTTSLPSDSKITSYWIFE